MPSRGEAVAPEMWHVPVRDVAYKPGGTVHLANEQKKAAHPWSGGGPERRGRCWGGSWLKE